MVAISSFKEPETPVRLQMNDVEVVLDKNDYGSGTLYVCEGSLSWERADKVVGFALNYYNISLHAISRDRTVCEKDCVYVLTDPHVEMPGVPRAENPERNEEDSDEEDEEPNVSELVLIPPNSAALDAIYGAIKLCQELNPDPLDMEDDEDDLFADAEDQPIFPVGAGGDTIENLARQLENSNVDVDFHTNGNDDEEFEDAD